MGASASRRGPPPWRMFCRMGICLRREAIHRVSPARGCAPPRHSSPRRAIRAVRDAMNRVSTWRTGHAAGRGRQRGRAMSNLGWSAAEPEVGRMVRMSASKRSVCPRRYARGGIWHRRLFEAIFFIGACTAGSATLHPRLLIARPLRGRSCCEGLMMGTGSVSEGWMSACVETRFIASHPLGA